MGGGRACAWRFGVDLPRDHGEEGLEVVVAQRALVEHPVLIRVVMRELAPGRAVLQQCEQVLRREGAHVRREDAPERRVPARLRRLVLEGQEELVTAEVVDQQRFDQLDAPRSLGVVEAFHVPRLPRAAEDVEHGVLAPAVRAALELVEQRRAEEEEGVRRLRVQVGRAGQDGLERAVGRQLRGRGASLQRAHDREQPLA